MSTRHPCSGQIMFPVKNILFPISHLVQGDLISHGGLTYKALLVTN